MGLDITIPDKPVERTYTVNAGDAAKGKKAKAAAPWVIKYMVTPAKAEAVAALVDTINGGRLEVARVELGRRSVTSIVSVEKDGQAATSINGFPLGSEEARKLLLDYVPGFASDAGNEALSLRSEVTTQLKN